MSGPQAALIDWIGTPLPRRLLTVARLRSGEHEHEVVSAGDYQSEVGRLSTAEERRETTERLLRLRRAS